jgi:hypothetical protein
VTRWIIVFSAGLIGFASAIATLLPRLTIDPDAGDTVKPLATTFRIKNTGFIPLSNVQPMIGVCTFKLGTIEFGGSTQNSCGGSLKRISYINKMWFAKWLTMDETLVLRIDDMITGVNFLGADISIAVEYQPWIFPWTQTFEFRFETRKEVDGTWTWTPRPLTR